MKSIYTCFLLILLTGVVWSQVEFSGYYENQFYPQQTGDEVLLQDYNKLRLDILSDISDEIVLRGDIVFQSYHGARTMNALDFIPVKLVAATLGQPVPAEMRALFDIRNEDRVFVDNLFLSVYTDFGTLRIGKQQIPWGSGYAWNPTDVFHDKNMLDPLYEKTGVNALNWSIPISLQGYLAVIVSPEQNWRNSTKAVKIKENMAGYDLSLSYAEKSVAETKYLNGMVINRENKIIGADFSGELLGVGIHGEGTYTQNKIDDNYATGLIGIDYTSDAGLFMMSEYYFKGNGIGSAQNYGFSDWMRMLGSSGENLGKEYFYSGMGYPVTELTNASLYLIGNLSDKSIIFMPWLDTSVSDNVELIMAGYFPAGDELTEFGGFGNGGFFRIRAYF
jgi:hypothetical protein